MLEERLQVHPDHLKGGQRLATVINERLPLADFAGTLAIGVDPALDQRLSLHISFERGRVTGNLFVFVEPPPNTDGGGLARVPLEGRFPDDPCFGLGVPLDEVSDALGEAPRAAYERARRAPCASPGGKSSMAGRRRR